METGFEGPCGADSVTSLERALDQAMERQTEAARHRSPRRQRSTPAADSAAGAALALADQPGALQLAPARLRWRGMEVSDEFQRYAERVARGEDLPPWRGPILAEPCPEFPWGAQRAPRTGTEPLPPAPVGAPWFRAAGAFAATSVLVIAGALAIVRARADIGSAPQVSAAAARPVASPPATVATPVRSDDPPIGAAVPAPEPAPRGGTAHAVAPQPPRRPPAPLPPPPASISVPLARTAAALPEPTIPAAAPGAAPPSTSVAPPPAPRPATELAKHDAPPRRSENVAPARVSPLLVESAPF